MMMSLLSIFDPSSFMMFNWMCSTMPFLCPILMLSWSSSNFNSLFKLIKDLVHEIFKFNDLTLLIFISIFVLIFISNVMGLIPYVFCATSHFSYNFSIGLTLWMTTMLWGMWNFSEHNIAHLTPMGCPLVLVPFMVLVEIVSSLIRPITLSLRLMSNMLAGHLILTLISSNIDFFSSILMSSSMFIIHTGMMMFELGVALIQSYIFSFLMFLYWKESK
uniref:ATP synthase subunit a n=1 Tax=Amyrsidea minuta TaxID=2364307 RepID=A0A386B2E0_9NEOP|nr:ATP synthase F0 subunit 6 [Amyrsidea minuta]